MVMLPRALTVVGVVVAGGLAAACSDDGASPDRAASVGLFVTTAPVQGAAGGLQVGDGAHQLVFDRITLVVSEVGLAGGQRSVVLEERVFLLEVPVGGGVRPLMASAVAPGRYDGVRIGLHAPDPDDPLDQALLAAHPELQGASVRVEGTWDGEPFTWVRAMDELRLVTLSPAVEIWGRTANVMLRLDVASWFRDEGGALVDPGEAVGDHPSAAAVVSRIRTSFAAFEDPDADGATSDD